MKSKARLGKLVNQKPVTAVAVTAAEKADEGEQSCSGALSSLPPSLLSQRVSRNHHTGRRATHATRRISRQLCRHRHLPRELRSNYLRRSAHVKIYHILYATSNRSFTRSLIHPLRSFTQPFFTHSLYHSLLIHFIHSSFVTNKM